MAKHERDREDLLAEATALGQRISLQIPGEREPAIVGFRRDGSASFYFDPSRAYHFTSAGQLRRAFVGELLFKAQRGHVVAMRRERKANVVALVSTRLDAVAQGRFLDEMQAHLDKLRGAIVGGCATIVGQVPHDADVAGRVRDWLQRFAGSITVAQTPRAG
jgi:hypothetical protein